MLRMCYKHMDDDHYIHTSIYIIHNIIHECSGCAIIMFLLYSGLAQAHPELPQQASDFCNFALQLKQEIADLKSNIQALSECNEELKALQQNLIKTQ